MRSFSNLLPYNELHIKMTVQVVPSSSWLHTNQTFTWFDLEFCWLWHNNPEAPYFEHTFIFVVKNFNSHQQALILTCLVLIMYFYPRYLSIYWESSFFKFRISCCSLNLTIASITENVIIFCISILTVKPDTHNLIIKRQCIKFRGY